jgi:hypothetical protein
MKGLIVCDQMLIDKEITSGIYDLMHLNPDNFASRPF